MLLQFLAQGIPINAEHVGSVRLITLGARHHNFQHRPLYRQHQHLVYMARLLFAEVSKILFETFTNNVLDVIFAHEISSCGEVLLGG